MPKYQPTPLAPLTDESLMPTGKYKDTRMDKVPASYLMNIYEGSMANPLVRAYIIDNLDAIRKEIKDASTSDD